MLDAQLQAIRDRTDRALEMGDVVESFVLRHTALDVHTLLSEVERLSADNAALREIAERVAANSSFEVHGIFRKCPFCHQEINSKQHPDWQAIFQHTADCPVTRARALLQAKGE